jgi:NAD(P)-dependent dehydrogenase (short-subunit alcohol dehydrogenase family)
MTRNYKNKTVVVTGAGGGLGRKLCISFGQAGANILALDLAKDELEKSVTELEKISIAVEGVVCDVTDPKACQVSIDRGRQRFGSIDVLINNAGITHIGLTQDTSIEAIEQVMRVNFFGSVNCTKACLPDLVENRGQIIVISSVAGFAPLVGRCAYSASKHALHGFFETLRVEQKEINVMMVCPAFIETKIRQHAIDGGVSLDDDKKHRFGKQMTSKQAAKKILQNARKEKRLLILGNVAQGAFWLKKLVPGVYDLIMKSKS